MRARQTPDEAKFFSYLGFRDLLFVYLYLSDDNVFVEFIEYKVIFCQQAVEKIAKALLLKLDSKHNSKNIANKYNHRLFDALNDIGKHLAKENTDNMNFFYKNLCTIGLDFYLIYPRKGLKIPRAVMPVPVRVRERAP